MLVPTAAVSTVGDYIDGVTDCDEITSTTFECDMTGSVGMTSLPWSSMGGTPNTIYFDDGQSLGTKEWHRFTVSSDGQMFIVALEDGEDDDFEDALEVTGHSIIHCLKGVDLQDRVVDCTGSGESCWCITITSPQGPGPRVGAATGFLF